jgi:hypothetical protein
MKQIASINEGVSIIRDAGLRVVSSTVPTNTGTGYLFVATDHHGEHRLVGGTEPLRVLTQLLDQLEIPVPD